jgi:hypothetical protein
MGLPGRLVMVSKRILAGMVGFKFGNGKLARNHNSYTYLTILFACKTTYVLPNILEKMGSPGLILSTPITTHSFQCQEFVGLDSLKSGSNGGRITLSFV